jgi:OmpA-OmpF porin, OOP family
MKTSHRAALCGVLLLPLLAPVPVDAQGTLGRLRDRARQEAEKLGERATAPAQTPAPAAEEASASPTPAAPAAANARPGEGAWANYDFVPGERVLFADDLSADRVGDFPRRMRLQDGNAEIVEWNGGRYLSIPAFTTLVLPLGEALPRKFTIEFEFYPGTTFSRSYRPVVLFAPERSPQDSEATRVNFGAREAGLMSGDNSMMTRLGEVYKDRFYTVRIMADGPHVKAYIDERRVSNAPNVEIVRGDAILIHVPGWGEEPSLIGNVRIAAGGRDLYDSLAAEGRVATQGILFDTGSDRIRPESTPTLKEITAMLRKNPQLRLMIEGHTDNVGQAATNQSLSERRAAAVRAYLVEQGIDAGRLESKGLGDTRPAAKNDAPEGRQQNRRVELVRL